MIGLEEANVRGKKAYLDGVDMFNAPQYLNPKEKEQWILGYEDEMHAETKKWIEERSQEDDLEFHPETWPHETEISPIDMDQIYTE